jgi:hypothetical protein
MRIRTITLELEIIEAQISSVSFTDAEVDPALGPFPGPGFKKIVTPPLIVALCAYDDSHYGIWIGGVRATKRTSLWLWPDATYTALLSAPEYRA